MNDDRPAGGGGDEGSRLASGELTGLLEQLASTEEAEPAEIGLQAGEVLGRFQVVRSVGRGGFGEVYEAKDLSLSRRVALKVLLGGKRGGATPAEWVQREAEAVGQLRHPAIVTLHDAGRTDGRTWLVYELLEGRTLHELLGAGPVPRAEARRILYQVACALAHAHAHGVVHRDLKPSNVFVEADGTVKVLDFGLAQVIGATGLAAGSPPFAAPEQWRGEPADARADVYAWGVLAAALLGGRVPEGPAPRSSATSGRLAALADAARAEEAAGRPRDGGALVALLDRIDRRRRWLRRGAVAALAVAAAAAVLFWPRPQAPPPGPFPLAIADADNQSGDPVLDGLGTLMASQLEASPSLAVMGRARLQVVLRAYGRPTGDRLDRDSAGFAAAQAGAAALIVPAAVRRGAGYALEAVARQPGTGELLFSVSEAVPGADGLLGAVERLGRRLQDELHRREPSVRTAAAEQARAVTTSLEAHRHYFDGLRCLERPSEGDSSWDTPDCADHFRRALAIDPDFPQAHFELAKDAFWSPATREEKQLLIGRALARIERVPARERPPLLAWKAWVDGDEAQALAILAEAEGKFPDEVRFTAERAELLYGMGRCAEALPPLARAWSLDPGLEESLDEQVWCLGVLGRDDELRKLAAYLAARRPSPGTLHAEQHARSWLGEHAAALAIARKAAVGGGRAGREDLLKALVTSGLLEEAEPLARRLDDEPGKDQRSLANLLLLQGRRREALASLEGGRAAGASDLGRAHRAMRRAAWLAVERDVAGVRRQVEEVRRIAPGREGGLAALLAHAGDAEGALALRTAADDDPAGAALVDALVAWRRQGAATALPALRRLRDGEPRLVVRGAPPEAAAWFAAAASAEAGPPEAALADVRRFERFYFPLGFVGSAALPRALVLEARLLDRLGRRDEARAALDRFDRLWRRADAGQPLLAEARALRRAIGQTAGPVH